MKLRDWLHPNDAAQRLAGDMSPPAAAAAEFQKAAAALQQLGVPLDNHVIAYWVPGRVEVFGKHTDYCGGQSLLAATQRGFAFLARPGQGRAIRVIHSKSSKCCEFALDSSVQPRLGHWSNYPQAVARRVARNFASASRGCDVAFSSNLPPSAGLSSSSALIVGTFLLLAQINELDQDSNYLHSIHSPELLAAYLGAVENGSSFGPLHGDRGVGTNGGSEDHTAILGAHPGNLVLYSFCPVRFERAIPVTPDLVFVVASSGVMAEKTGTARSKYNRVSRLVSTIVELWQAATVRTETTLAAILSSAPDSTQHLRTILRDSRTSTFSAVELCQRLNHFETEQSFIHALPRQIDRDSLHTFGDLARQSHEAAAALLGNQTVETNRLVELAYARGAHAASAFGAGFGGSVWALVDQESADTFSEQWQNAYLEEFPAMRERSVFFQTHPAGPAEVLS